MKVKMKTTYAGPAGTCNAGGTIDVPPAEAKDPIGGGYAVAVEEEGVPTPGKKKQGKGQKAETATLPAGENAALSNSGGEGAATPPAGDGDDTAPAGEGDDTLASGEGADTVPGEQGADA